MQHFATNRRRLALLLALFVLFCAAWSVLGQDAESPAAVHRSHPLMVGAQWGALISAANRVVEWRIIDQTGLRLLKLAARCRAGCPNASGSLLANRQSVTLRILSEGSPRLERAPPLLSL